MSWAPVTGAGSDGEAGFCCPGSPGPVSGECAVGVLSSFAAWPAGWPRRVSVIGSMSATALLASSLVVPASAADTPAETAVDASVASGALNATRDQRGYLTAPDGVAASVNARLSGEPVEDLSQRTEFGSVYALPDGQWTSQQASGPVWVRRGGDGAAVDDWNALDLTLSLDPDGVVRPAAAPSGLELVGTSAPATVAGADDTVASVTDPATGKATVLAWPVDLPEPVLEGKRATYADVSPGLDLVVEATTSGFEQYFVAADAAAVAAAIGDPLVVTSEAGGVTRTRDGGLTVTNQAGQLVASSGTPLAWDATVEEVRPDSLLEAPTPITDETPVMAPLPEVDVLQGDASAKPALQESGLPEGPATPVDPLEADPLAEATPLTSAVDVTSEATAEVALDGVQELAKDPETVYPLVIDPQVNLNLGLDLYVQTNVSSDTSGYTYMQMGTYDGGTNIARAFVNFPTTAIAGKKVSAASLELWNFYSWSCTARQWDVWHTGGISTATRWSNQPGTITKYASSTTTKGYSSSCAEGWVNADVTAAFKYAADRSDPQITLGFRAASETDSYGWKKFYSANNGSYVPSVWVTYNSVPNTVTSWTYSTTDQHRFYIDPATGTKTLYVRTTKPGYRSVVSDADGGNVKALYSVKEGSTTVWNSLAGSTVASGGTSILNAGTAGTALVDGHTYTPYAVASDGSLTSASKTGTTFTVDVTKPAAPTVTASKYTNGGWADTTPTGNTFTLSSTSADVVGFDVYQDGGAATQLVTNAKTGTWTWSPGAGSHTLKVIALDKAGNPSPATTFTFGSGGAALTSPTSGLKSTGNFTVKASSAPAATGTVTPSLWYRLAGTANPGDYNAGRGSTTNWSKVKDLTAIAAGTAVNVSTTWDAAAAAELLGKSRVPVLLDVQVCFTYSAGPVVRCTWNDVDTTDRSTVVRVPHAFGDSFPTADAGPGQVALWTGEFNTSATDVSVPGYVGDLSVSRSYSSQAGPDAASVFGPGWSPSFDGVDVGIAGYDIVDNTDVDGTFALVDDEGGALVYRQPGNTKIADQPGDYTAVDNDTKEAGARLSLSGTGTAARLLFTDADGSVTTFANTGTTAADGRVWAAVSVTEPGTSKATSFTTDAAGRVTRILAPIPDGVTCAASGALAAGCRAINVTYGSVPVTTDPLTGAAVTATTATRATSISYTAFDPATSSVTTTPVATYGYDTGARLSSVTDPRTGLKTSYTYAGASTSGVPLLTQVTDSGRAPWKFAYGSAAQDAQSLLTVKRGAPVAGGADIQVARFVYKVDLTGATAGLPAMTATAVDAWGQAVAPTYGAAVFGQDRAAGAAPAAADWPYADLQFTDDQGRVLNTSAYGAGDWQHTATRYDAAGRVTGTWDDGAIAQLRAISAGGADLSAEQVDSYATITRYNSDIKTAAALTWDPDGAGTQPAQTIAAGTVVTPAGTLVTDTWAPAREVDGALVREHNHTDYDGGAPNNGINPTTGVPFRLPTTATQTQADGLTGSGNPAVPVATDEPVLSRTVSEYTPIDGKPATDPTSGWMLGQPTRTIQRMGAGGASSSADIITQTRYDNEGRTVEVRKPGSTGTDAATTRTFYYTTAAQTGTGAACGGKPQWAGLACMTTTGQATPTLPTQTTTAYNLYLAPAVVTESLGATTRTTTTTFGKAGRTDTVTTTVTGLPDSTPVPVTKTLYDETTGTPVGTASLNGTTETSRITQAFDLWGRPTAYTDTDGAITTTTYDTAGRVATVTDPTGRTTTYGYDGATASGVERRGLTTSLTVTGGPAAVGTFTAAYDQSGNLLTQQLPDGVVTQTVSYDRAGDLDTLTYQAPDTTGQPVPILAWTVTSDVQGSTTQITSSTSSGDTGTGRTQEFTYDAAQRLTAATDTIGGTCTTTRTYSFDLRGNRTALGTTGPGDGATAPEGTDPCTQATTVTKSWTYDDADHIKTGATINGVTAAPYEYDALGRQTKLPGADTTSGTDIKIGYYDTDAAHTLITGALTTTYTLDPAGRRSQESTTGTRTDGTPVNEQVTRHYTDTSDNPSWATTTGAQPSTTWYGGSIGGDLGIQVTTTGEGGTATTTVNVDLVDTLGSVATTITLPSTGQPTQLGAVGTYDEYGNTITTGPSTGAINYGWLGGKERATNNATGLVLMGARLYNGTTGLFTSTDPVPGGNTTTYTYPQDPINSTDLDGQRRWWKRAWSWYSRNSPTFGFRAAAWAETQVNRLHSREVGWLAAGYSLATGGHCRTRSGLRICQGGWGHGYARGGTTFGTTYMAAPGRGSVTPDRIAHEKVHVRQWNRYGMRFPLRYLMAGQNPCRNRYEKAAGWRKGGYRCR